MRVARAILDNARHAILVADRLKLERVAPVRIGHLRDIDFFVTDKLASPALRDICRTPCAGRWRPAAQAGLPPAPLE